MNYLHVVAVSQPCPCRLTLPRHSRLPGCWCAAAAHEICLALLRRFASGSRASTTWLSGRKFKSSTRGLTPCPCRPIQANAAHLSGCSGGAPPPRNCPALLRRSEAGSPPRDLVDLPDPRVADRGRALPGYPVGKAGRQRERGDFSCHLKESSGGRPGCSTATCRCA